MNIIAEEPAQFPQETFNAVDIYRMEQVRSVLVDMMCKYRGEDSKLDALLSDALASSHQLRKAMEESFND